MAAQVAPQNQVAALLKARAALAPKLRRVPEAPASFLQVGIASVDLADSFPSFLVAKAFGLESASLKPPFSLRVDAAK